MIRVRSFLPRASARFYSIDDFKRGKTDYKYGQNFNEVKTVEETYNPEVVMEKMRVEHEQSVVLNDPRLQAFRKGSPEYKEKLYDLYAEYAENEEKNRSKYEFWERMRTVGLGVLLVAGAIGSHQLMMNYEYWKKKLLADWYYQIDDSKAADLADPKKNRNAIDALVAKLKQELDPEAVAAVKDSTTTPGLYVAGAYNGKKLPLRAPFFDGMYIRDVSVRDGYLAVVSDKGDLYHCKNTDQPIKVNLPCSLLKCSISSDYIYGLTNKGNLIYVPRSDTKVPFTPCGARSWIGTKYNSYNTVKMREPVADFALGSSHCLILGKSGKVYVSSTGSITQETNCGQLGLPEASPLAQSFLLEPHTPVELAINNQIVQDAQGKKTLAPRKFVSVACSDSHSLACDSDNNLWAWGSNSVGQCAIDVTYNSLVQPVPKKVLTAKDLQKAFQLESVSLQKVFAGQESTYVVANSGEKQLVFSLGGGIRGQLGNSQFLHVSSTPSLVKALDLVEFNEDLQKVCPIGLKDLSVGNSHVFVTLDNAGNNKDVVAWGENINGQLANGRRGKMAKPSKVPQLIEPEDVTESDPKALAKRMDRIANSSLRLSVEKSNQVVKADSDSTVIYYKPNTNE